MRAILKGLFTLGVINLVAASGIDILPKPISVDRAYDNFQVNLDLGHGKAYNSRTYQNALIFLEGLKTLSSCHRLAASTLIDTCQNAPESSSVEIVLSEIKEEFAAKIAACELSAVRGSGKSVIPPACSKFLPAKDACHHVRGNADKLCYASLNRVEVTACVTALEVKPQSWTSYSNALQNAANTCQASRLTIEKEQMLEQIKTALEVATSAQLNAHQTFEKVFDELKTDIAHHSALQDKLRLTVQQDWRSLSEEMAEFAHHAFETMLTDIENAAKDFADKHDHQAVKSLDLGERSLEMLRETERHVEGTLQAAGELAMQQQGHQSSLEKHLNRLMATVSRMQASADFGLAGMDLTSEHLSTMVQNMQVMDSAITKVAVISQQMAVQAYQINDTLFDAAALARLVSQSASRSSFPFLQVSSDTLILYSLVVFAVMASGMYAGLTFSSTLAAGAAWVGFVISCVARRVYLAIVARYSSGVLSAANNLEESPGQIWHCKYAVSSILIVVALSGVIYSHLDIKNMSRAFALDLKTRSHPVAGYCSVEAAPVPVAAVVPVPVAAQKFYDAKVQRSKQGRSVLKRPYSMCQTGLAFDRSLRAETAPL